jgi:GNAT superfamily N-acetyltransferase
MLHRSLKRKGVSLPLIIRPPTIEELAGLSDLCFRSKAVWGYDEEFMEACLGELSFGPRDLEFTPIALAEHNGKPIGVAQLRVVGDEADLLKLFVEPNALRSGTGKALLAWAIDVAKKLGAERLTIEADPDAAPFYRSMGAYDVGQAPSGSVPGRMLPKLVINLGPAADRPSGFRNGTFSSTREPPKSTGCGSRRDDFSKR